ncbi:glutamate--tRNA ligase [Winogradskyella aquimaris]|uniref:Glutamate--tRNA ligase n=1 Tax=Winogradskyella aquimaris TaxID=864074 RepID=A0ABU5EJH3_9FLAO|nr:glutamate--tRNA ligase [Winogradskyella aquimaris]MDY2586509.1 glutamate--tRNA ligase [Winogradskyella aquimaris]
MSKKVRVRFAPSPTGPLHIGGVRTALFNYLFAKKHKGDFVLRIEDTDQNRYVEGAEEYIVEALNWCGIPFDEGPGKNEKFGPYRQSERKHMYKQYADQLIAEGKAYYAFDTSEELDAHRKQHEAEGKTFIYNWHNREKGRLVNSLVLTEEETQAKIDAGEDYVVRFKSPQDETLHLKDIIRGDISIDTNILDDKILFKSDGMPTYHLANIVDDYLMEITHVIRGEEWLPSLALHNLLYDAFGWDIPEFAHLPLILKPNPATYINKSTIYKFTELYTEEALENSDYKEDEIRKFIRFVFENPKNISQSIKINDNKDSHLKKDLKAFLKKGLYGKLSKRDGDKLGFPVFPLEWVDQKTNEVARGYKEDGYFAEAVVNFLAFLGWNPGTEQEIFSLDELVEAFNLSKVNKAGARFDPDKTKWFNHHYMQQQLDLDLAKEFQAKNILLKDIDVHYIALVIGLIKERATFVSDFWELSHFFFVSPTDYDEKASKKAIKDDTADILNQVVGLVNATEDFTVENLQTNIKGWITDNEIGFGKVMMPLRLALVGALQGPDVFDIMFMIGQAETAKRIEALVKTL